MRLPDAIFQRRLESETEELRAAGIHFEASEDGMEYTVSLTDAPGKFLDNGQLFTRTQHSVLIELTRDYPYPGGLMVYWLTPIFHPNIRPEDGAVCIQLVNQWSEGQNLLSVINALYQLLKNPNPQSPLNEEAARYYLEHPELEQNVPKGPRVVKL